MMKRYTWPRRRLLMCCLPALLTGMAPVAALAHSTNPRAVADWPITGRITSANGEGLPGVTVVLKGTTRGTTSGPDGSFSLHGLRADGRRLLEAREAKRINAVMLTCGTYDAAGEFAYRVGLPAKSGVGGGIIAVIPGRCTLCVWSPGLDARGNSVAGAAALDHFTTLTGWSVF